MYHQIEHYIIRDWQMDDVASIVKYANNRKIWQNLRDGFPNPYSTHDAELFVTQVNEANPRTAFAIASEFEAIGSIGLMLGKDVHRFTAEMGYWLAEPFWGKGIMTQAVRFLTAWAFRSLKLHRISAEPYSTNLASHRVLEKAEFSCEGVLRSSVFKDGKVLDQFLYSYIGNVTTQPINSAEPKGRSAD